MSVIRTVVLSSLVRYSPMCWLINNQIMSCLTVSWMCRYIIQWNLAWPAPSLELDVSTTINSYHVSIFSYCTTIIAIYAYHFYVTIVTVHLYLLYYYYYLFLAAEDGSNYQYEIIFDEPFTGGHTWRCGAGKGYCLSASSFVNISYGKRLETSKKGGRRSLPANLLPQGTTYQADQVDYGYSPKANTRVNQKFERSPKQNHSKKPEKQSYDRVEVRLLKRPAEKSMCIMCGVCSI